MVRDLAKSERLEAQKMVSFFMASLVEGCRDQIGPLRTEFLQLISSGLFDQGKLVALVGLIGDGEDFLSLDFPIDEMLLRWLSALSPREVDHTAAACKIVAFTEKMLKISQAVGELRALPQLVLQVCFMSDNTPDATLLENCLSFFFTATPMRKFHFLALFDSQHRSEHDVRDCTDQRRCITVQDGQYREVLSAKLACRSRVDQAELSLWNSHNQSTHIDSL